MWYAFITQNQYIHSKKRTHVNYSFSLYEHCVIIMHKKNGLHQIQTVKRFFIRKFQMFNQNIKMDVTKDSIRGQTGYFILDTN